jgi:hypothetical protein
MGIAHFSFPTLPVNAVILKFWWEQQHQLQERKKQLFNDDKRVNENVFVTKGIMGGPADWNVNA